MATRTGASPSPAANRYRVAHKPTKTAELGNWAVVRRTDQHLVGRHRTREAAQRAAASRGSAGRRSRQATGR